MQVDRGEIFASLTPRGRCQEFIFFSLLRGGNYANLFKNLIKFQIFDEKLGTIVGLGPWASPVVMPLLTPF